MCEDRGRPYSSDTGTGAAIPGNDTGPARAGPARLHFGPPSYQRCRAAQSANRVGAMPKAFAFPAMSAL